MSIKTNSENINLIKNYYQFFNQKNYTQMLDMISDQITHETNQGTARIGKEKFNEFLKHMDTCYNENLTDINVFCSENSNRLAAEFIVNGTYKVTDSGLPPAKNQKYKIPAATFFTIENSKITKVSTHYNLNEWIEMVK